VDQCFFTPARPTAGAEEKREDGGSWGLPFGGKNAHRDLHPVETTQDRVDSIREGFEKKTTLE